MKKTAYLLASMLVFAATATSLKPVIASLEVTPAQENSSGIKENLANSLSGAWEDRSGGFMVIREKDGFLDVLGRDAGSHYESICLVERANSQKYQCVGDGYNTKEDFRFLYQSTMELTPEGKILEKWQAKFADGEKQGEVMFEKQTTPER